MKEEAVGVRARLEEVEANLASLQEAKLSLEEQQSSERKTWEDKVNGGCTCSQQSTS